MKFWKMAGLGLAAVLLAGSAGMLPVRASAETPVIKVFKSPSCGCCGKWVERARAAGFRVEVTNTDDLDVVKKQAGVPGRLQACHTALVDGYVVEGHVPLGAVKRLLKLRPRARGISVPGMPAGSPGMEYGNEREPFNVVLFGGSGSEKIF